MAFGVRPPDWVHKSHNGAAAFFWPEALPWAQAASSENRFQETSFNFSSHTAGPPS
jgi:hypothetical protein